MDIILIRHGRPESADNPKLNAAGYTRWIRRYNASTVAPSSRPRHIKPNYIDCFIVSSRLKRAVHSANIYTNRDPDLRLSALNEMDIPRYKLPFTLRAWTWVYLNRVLWMLGLKGNFESYGAAKKRSKIAAQSLEDIASKHRSILVFGHGYMNYHIRRELVKRGWQLQQKSSEFWGVTRLVL